MAITQEHPQASVAPMRLSGLARAPRWAFAAVAYAFAAGTVLQFFLAGYAVFTRSEENWKFHGMFGGILALLVLVMLALAFASRAPRGVIVRTGALVGLFVLQVVWLMLSDVTPIIGALHAVNGLALFWMSWYMAAQARRLV